MSCVTALLIPEGNNGEFQFNNNGSFSGSPNLKVDGNGNIIIYGMVDGVRTAVFSVDSTGIVTINGINLPSKTYVYAPATGSNTLIPGDARTVVLNPAGLLLNANVTLPDPATLSAKEQIITISATKTITTFGITGAGGVLGTVLGGVTTLLAGNTVQYKYIRTNNLNSWVRHD